MKRLIKRPSFTHRMGYQETGLMRFCLLILMPFILVLSACRTTPSPSPVPAPPSTAPFPTAAQSQALATSAVHQTAPPTQPGQVRGYQPHQKPSPVFPRSRHFQTLKPDYQYVSPAGLALLNQLTPAIEALGLPEGAFSLIYLEYPPQAPFIHSPATDSSRHPSSPLTPSGEAVLIHPDAIHTAASTIKFPLALYLLDEVASGQMSFQQRLSLHNSDRQPGSGDLQFAPAGSVYTLRELLNQMITASDNTATQMLIRLLSEAQNHPALNLVRTRFSLPELTDQNRITARGMASVMHEWLENPRQNPYYEYLKTWMQAASKTYLAAKWPQTLPYANKYGFYQGHYADLVFAQAQRPFVVIAYVEAPTLSEEQVEAFLAEVGEACLNLAQRP